MTQQIINYDEEMVGANHPTKSDTLNRSFLISHGINGGLNAATSDPASPEDYQYYWKTDDKELRVYDGAAWQTVGVKLATGAYTGDGNATQAVTGVGFQPKVIRILEKSAGYATFADDQMGGYTHTKYFTGDFYDNDTVISLDSDGFTVGDGTPSSVNQTNQNAQAYAYECWG